MTLVLEEMDIARVNPYQSDQGTPSDLGLVRTPNGQRRSPNSGGGGDTRSATYPVDDVHQAWIT